MKIRAFGKLIYINTKAVIYVLLALAVLAFAYNLFKTNKKADVSDKDVERNISYVKTSMNKATIDGIQAELDALGNSSNEDAAKSVKARYMQKFKGSVVVGDSLTEGLSVYGFLSDQQVFSKIGASVVYGDDMFDQAAGVKPRNAFFAFGMNDMGNFSGDADKFAARYEELITDFRKKSPKTKIYVCSISTPNREAIAGNSSIGHYKEFNKAIRKMCKRMKLPYIDTSAILPDHPELYAPDGIHADPSYYPMWLDMMREAAGI